jgi:hypothetical protein
MVFGRVFAPPLAFGNDVVLEGYRILVALHNDEFTPSPCKMNSQRKLVAPRRNAMNDPIAAQHLNQRIDRREDGIIQKLCVVLVVFLLPLHRLTLCRQLFVRDVLERSHP